MVRIARYLPKLALKLLRRILRLLRFSNMAHPEKAPTMDLLSYIFENKTVEQDKPVRRHHDRSMVEGLTRIRF